jgi:bifunctional pyridoxal-dependent enzyme with beta-cystathionase and maltose regulon repressor activities
MKFISDPLIDSERRALIDTYDDLFEQIKKSVKKSPEHLALLVKERKAHSKTSKFLDKHKYYYAQKRTLFRDHIEELYKNEDNEVLEESI